MNIDPRRKKLLWRATHRGTKEMDLVLGGFAAEYISGMGERELSELEAIIALPDQDLQSWIMNQRPVPAQHSSKTLARLLAYRP
jgi:antitoxin CptB